MINGFSLLLYLFTKPVKKPDPGFFTYQTYLCRFSNGILKCIPCKIIKTLIPGVHKIYQVELDKALKKEDMESITKGITLDDGPIKVDEIAYATESRDVVGVEIHSGRNRIVRRIFEHLQYKVKKLDRVVFAGLTKKDVPRGRWRFLTEMEVANLKMITGNRKKVS